MPRCYLGNRREYIQKDFSRYVIGELRLQGISEAELGNELGITQQAVSQKIKKHKFTYSDVLGIFKLFDADDETILRFMKEKK